jgi:1,4-alpha-glucan branching enzyme
VAFRVRFHYDNAPLFNPPYLYVEYAGGEPEVLPPTGVDGYGVVWDAELERSEFRFKFKEGPGLEGRWEGLALTRSFEPIAAPAPAGFLNEVWCRGDKAFIYPMEPRRPEAVSAAGFLHSLPLKPGMYVPGSGGFSGLGANVLADGQVLFGLYQPNACRVFLMGSFNDWQRPNSDADDESRFIELKLYRGYYGIPNLWLAVTDLARPGDQYKFCVIGGVPADEKGRLQRYVTDPYSRLLEPDHNRNNSVVADPTGFQWHDAGWRTPDTGELVVYELSVYGFTEGDPDIEEANHGRFRGITERIRDGYFNHLGVNALALMPLAEVPSPQGPTSLGYDPQLFCTPERDFGTPDDLRELVDEAHRKGLAVVLDQVFNHTTNTNNLLWKMVLEHPGEEFDPGEGGLYFSGRTRWGNRVATEKSDVQNMLTDACKLAVVEYHVDGFRFDATHTDFTDHGFMERLAHELKGFKPDVLLIAENLPNQPDLNREGFNGFAQWCDPFHDKLKALLREGRFEGDVNTPDRLGEVFFFCKDRFAAHTNNVVNYTESHDEPSIAFEVGTNPVLDHPAAKERKGRLAMLATITALGQPMLYMGQEFNVDRGRNYVRFHWPSPLSSNGFFEWTRRLIHLRRRYPALRLTGYNPAADGRFTWVLAPWLPPERGGGRRVIGWRSRPNEHPHDTLLVLLNFENADVRVDVDFGVPGIWVKLADIDRVNDIPPAGSNSAGDPTALRTNDGRFGGFTLPSSSGFIYKWESR